MYKKGFAFMQFTNRKSILSCVCIFTSGPSLRRVRGLHDMDLRHCQRNRQPEPDFRCVPKRQQRHHGAYSSRMGQFSS